jgi:hypothetical protein
VAAVWRRRLALILATLAALVAVAWWALDRFSSEVSIDIDEPQLQARLDAQFPKEKCLLGACLTLSQPKVKLSPQANRVELSAQFVATLGKRSMPGAMELTGRPHYAADAGAFYLKDVEVRRFDMTGNAPDFDEVVRTRGPALTAAILQQVPLYSLKTDSRYGTLARRSLRSIEVVDGRMRVRFINPLSW